MQSLITPEEALQLGEIEDHSEIEALVERAWEAVPPRPDGAENRGREVVRVEGTPPWSM